jgi:hypothetical protein
LRTEREMLDIIYILGGVAIFVVFAAYAHALRRI